MVSSLFLVYRYDPGEQYGPKTEDVASVHEYSSSMTETSRNVLVCTYQRNGMGWAFS